MSCEFATIEVIDLGVEGRMKPFLTARWENLVMINWKVAPALLNPYVPAGTELDTFNGDALLSVVAFQFLNTRVLGMPIPFHVDFEEINLRFYVVRKFGNEYRRGVVFIREFVPRFWIAFVARALYNEPYRAVSMGHRIEHTENAERSGVFRWRIEREHVIEFQTIEKQVALEVGSREAFIAEHYWGYTRQKDGRTMEYQVEHPTWRIWRDIKVNMDWDPSKSYGRELAEALSRPPDFSFLAQGSVVSIHLGSRF
jgi:uncharacterized protein